MRASQVHRRCGRGGSCRYRINAPASCCGEEQNIDAIFSEAGTSSMKKDKGNQTISLATRMSKTGKTKSDTEIGETENMKPLSRFKFDHYDPKIEDWLYYFTRFEVELNRQGITEEKDRATLLVSSVGPAPFKILVDSFSPRDIQTVSYDEIKHALNSYYSRNVSVFAERRAFTLRFRQQGETIRQYVLDLKALARTCAFGRTLEERLQEQLLLGINESNWQEELIKQFPTTQDKFSEIEKVALLLESSCNQRKLLSEMNSNKPKGNANRIKTQHFQNKKDMRPQFGQGEKPVCTSCGFTHNTGTRCPAEGIICFACKGSNHFSRMCRSTRRRKFTGRITTDERDVKSNGSSSDSDQEIRKIGKEGHPGEGAMKSIAKIQVWWPHIENDIEEFVKRCKGCQSSRPTGPQESPIFFWNVPTEKWSRVHVDFAGPFEGKHWLILVDATTKWMEIIPMTVTTASKTIDVLREIFCRFGLPKTIVSDNGPQFKSHEFSKFCSDNNIKHVTSSPYHPLTNGLAERAVRSFKERIKASRNDSGSLQLKVQKFLISHRNAIHSTTGRSPAALMLGRNIRTRLDLIRPDVQASIEAAQRRQAAHKENRRVREFAIGDKVRTDQPATGDRGRLKTFENLIRRLEPSVTCAAVHFRLAECRPFRPFSRRARRAAWAPASGPPATLVPQSGAAPWIQRRAKLALNLFARDGVSSELSGL
ncbi:unnamed protein product [Nesidiocoris tenuis]|uniref:RNA-directed DNA polymerase n=1 Tax=Nesidiocoris tenuis TaxID=355587 RepID=A0A6H5GTT6_9HEMI|nr:unnamed protein product [Nesidiocoris tenuis]